MSYYANPPSLSVGKKLRRLPILLLAACSCRAIARAGVPESAAVLGCAEKSDARLVLIRSRIEIGADFLDGKTADFRERFIRESAEQQIKHLIGAFKDPGLGGALKPALGAYRGRWTLGAERTLTSPPAPRLDAFWPPKRGVARSEYVRWALARPSEPRRVVSVEYSVEVLILGCGLSSRPDEDFARLFKKISLPLDPYLTFWVNGPEQRHPLSAPPFHVEEAPDCFGPEFAKFGVPDDGWFFWSPNRTDKEGACRLKKNPLVISPEFTLMPGRIGRLDAAGASLPHQAAAAFIFGKITDDDGMSFKTSYADIRRQLGPALKTCATAGAAACFDAWNARLGSTRGGKPEELGLSNLKIFLKYLNSVYGLKGFSFGAKSDSSLTLRLNLAQEAAGDALTMDVYYGPTRSFDTPAKSDYWRFLRDAFYRADVLAYIGHADLGASMSFAAVRKRAQEASAKPPRKRDRDLWLGVFNCEGFSYFGYDLDDVFNAGRSIYLVSNSGAENGVQFPLAFLNYLRFQGTSQPFGLDSAVGRYVHGREFLTVQKIRTVAPGAAP